MRYSKPSGLWPKQEKIDFHHGFDDGYLELLCTEEVDSEIDKRFYFKAKSPVLFWTTEVYGFGRCYRKWLNWPSWLPIPVYGDHGVQLSGTFAEHEVSNTSNYYLSWFNQRIDKISKLNQKKVIAITHPWIVYRRLCGYEKKINSKGTLIFYPHSIEGMDIISYDWDLYFERLTKISVDFMPFVICMHRHDINKGCHKQLRKYGLPIVTIGNPFSSFFVDRFYDLVSHFSYATSCTGGSELFYCEEFGVRYFIFGDEPIYYNYSHDQMPLGQVKYADDTERLSNLLKKEIFSTIPPQSSYFRDKFISSVLGLDNDYKTVVTYLKSIFISETIRLFPLIIRKLIFYFFFTICLTYIKRIFKKSIV